ncbi:MAG TPA: acyl-CoA dehydrogenase family protein [Anaeromyxobacteraceae bacterium]|nr:acyl-CoA dehydrogenase family protein [Anaeromyxobacteraceae bacterium]
MVDRKTASFVQSLCMGEIEEEIIVPFPDMRTSEKEMLSQVLASVRQLVSGREKEFREWDRTAEMPASFVDELRSFGLFGLVIPEAYGGIGFGSAAYSRVLQEIAQYDSSVALTVGAHSSIGMRGLLLFGSDAQKERWLSKLASGELIAAFCLTEPGAGSDAAAVRTTARRDGNDWILNGEKIWITNGGMADLFTVFAKTPEVQTGQHKASMTAFVVTRDLPGVSTGPHEDKMGIRASSTTTVTFSDVRVPGDHVLGELGQGFKAAMRILNAGRTGLGGGSVGGMKKLIRLAAAQAKERHQFGRAIAEFGMIKEKIGLMVVDCYASESVVSMVAGLIDQGYEDYAVEAAISKVFATEALWRTADEALQIAGGSGYMRELPYERAIRDSRINRIFEGTNEILRLFIALTAMNDVGTQLKELAAAVRNSVADPIKGFGVLSGYARKRASIATGLVGEKRAFTLLHPEVKDAAAIVEEGTRDLAAAADRVLRKHGGKIVGKQFATKRIADILIDLFVLSCVLSRANTAVEEKGEKGAVRELEILGVFAGRARRRMRSNVHRIDDNDDDLVKALAEHAFENDGYAWDTL